MWNDMTSDAAITSVDAGKYLTERIYSSIELESSNYHTNSKSKWQACLCSSRSQGTPYIYWRSLSIRPIPTHSPIGLTHGKLLMSLTTGRQSNRLSRKMAATLNWGFKKRFHYDTNQSPKYKCLTLHHFLPS